MKYLQLFKYRFNLLKSITLSLVLVIIVFIVNIFITIDLLSHIIVIYGMILVWSFIRGDSDHYIEYIKLTKSNSYMLHLIDALQRVIIVLITLGLLLFMSNYEFFLLDIVVGKDVSIIDVLLIYISFVINASFLYQVFSYTLTKDLFQKRYKALGLHLFIYVFVFLIYSLLIDYTLLLFDIQSQINISNLSIISHNTYLHIIPIFFSLIVWYMVFWIYDKKDLWIVR